MLDDKTSLNTDQGKHIIQTDVLSEKQQKLQIEKLEREINVLKRPYLNPSVLAPIATIIAAGFALIWAFWTHWFDFENQRIQNENTLLENKKIELKRDTAYLEKRNKMILDSFEYMKSYVAKNESKMAIYRQQDSILQRKIFDVATKKKVIKDLKNLMNSDYAINGIRFHVIDAITNKPVVNASASIIARPTSEQPVGKEVLQTKTDLNGEFYVGHDKFDQFNLKDSNSVFFAVVIEKAEYETYFHYIKFGVDDKILPMIIVKLVSKSSRNYSDEFDNSFK